jgi:hypothetical protein
MTVAFDAYSNGGAATTGNVSWTHTPVGTPRGVVVFVRHSAGADSIGDVTYGGVTLTEMAGSPYTVSTGSEGDGLLLSGYLLGASVPTSGQTVVVNDNGGALSKRAFCFTVTAAANIEEIDTTSGSGSGANPSGTLSLGARESFCAFYGVSGQNDVAGIAPLTNWTSREEFDVGSLTEMVYTYDIVGTSDVTVGWTQTAEEYGFFSAAIAEVVGGGGGVKQLQSKLNLLGVGA